MIEELIKRLEGLRGPDEMLDAEIYAALHVPELSVKRAPPTDDFGPRDRWQFFTKDGSYFLGTEAKQKFKPVTSSIDAALMLVRPDDYWLIERVSAENSPLRNFGVRDGMFRACVGDWGTPSKAYHEHPAIALCIAALKARSSTQPLEITNG